MMPFKRLAYHLLLHFVQREGFLHVLLRILNIIIHFRSRLYGRMYYGGHSGGRHRGHYGRCRRIIGGRRYSLVPHRCAFSHDLVYQFLQLGNVLTHVKKHLIQYFAFTLKTLPLVLCA